MSTIVGWLEGLGLAQYVPVFAENAVDSDVLFDLTEADLEKLGIPLGDRKRMLKAIAELPAEFLTANEPNSRNRCIAALGGRATPTYGDVLRSGRLDCAFGAAGSGGHAAE